MSMHPGISFAAVAPKAPKPEGHVTGRYRKYPDLFDAVKAMLPGDLLLWRLPVEVTTARKRFTYYQSIRHYARLSGHAKLFINPHHRTLYIVRAA